MTDTLLETLVVQVKADTRAASQSLNAFSAATTEALGTGMESAERRMSSALERFVRTGKFNFDSLRQLALGVLADIAAASVRNSLGQIFGGGGGGGGLLGSILSTIPILGLPGRAMGGTVSANKPYLVGERGPELFVPEGAGQVEVLGNRRSSGARPVTINVTVNGGSGDPRALSRSAGQVAVAVRRAMARAERDL
jgi:Lambda phage tail tape-measure protein (Tape_meas_lam_C)